MFNTKLRMNPESEVGLMVMAGKSYVIPTKREPAAAPFSPETVC